MSLGIGTGISGSGLSNTVYALKGDGTNLRGLMALDHDLASGDTSKLTFRNTAAVSGANMIAIDAATAVAGAERGYITQSDPADVIFFNVANVGSAKFDGVVIANSTEPYPTDGLTHTVELTADATMKAGSFFSSNSTTLFSLSTIIKYESTTSARGYESWTFSRANRSLIKISNDQGTGQDIILSNVTPSDWVVVP